MPPRLVDAEFQTLPPVQDQRDAIARDPVAIIRYLADEHNLSYRAVDCAVSAIANWQYQDNAEEGRGRAILDLLKGSFEDHHWAKLEIVRLHRRWNNRDNRSENEALDCYRQPPQTRRRSRRQHRIRHSEYRERSVHRLR